MSDEEAFVSTLSVAHAELKSTAGDKAHVPIFLNPHLWVFDEQHTSSPCPRPSVCMFLSASVSTFPPRCITAYRPAD